VKKNHLQKGAAMRDLGLGVESMAVLVAVVAGPGCKTGHPGTAWTPRIDLEKEHGAGQVDLLIGSGWLDVWEGVIGGPLVTLTPLAAARLNVELDEFDTDETPGWVASGEAEHPVRVPPLRYHVPLPYPERVVDKSSVPPVEYLRDEAWSDEPVTLWGMPVPIDHRIRGKRAG
jgi:hypothetical protein